MSELINQLFNNLQQKMMADLNMTKGVTHPGMKGGLTELNWINWLEKQLPKRYSVTTGKVVDYSGRESEQIDIIIFDRQYSPFVFCHNGIDYVTAESVYAVFEVKQDLSKEHIEYAAKKAESVRKLHRTSAPIVYSTGIKPPKEPHRIFAGILTTTCKWKDPANKLEEHLQTLAKEQELDVLCAIDSISCRATYERNTVIILGKIHGEIVSVQIDKNSEKNILIHLFLTILLKLQIIGTVPAIEFDKYFGDIAPIQEIFEEESASEGKK